MRTGSVCSRCWLCRASRLTIKRALGLRLGSLTLWDGRAFLGIERPSSNASDRRLVLVERQIEQLEATRRERLSAPRTRSRARSRPSDATGGDRPDERLAPGDGVLRLASVSQSARSRRLAGRVGTPYNSGDTERDQGISKAGNRRVCAIVVEIAWLLAAFPARQCAHPVVQARFGGGGLRMRRIGIVALARKLLIALWRYLEDGVIPEGARLIASEL